MPPRRAMSVRVVRRWRRTGHVRHRRRGLGWPGGRGIAASRRRARTVAGLADLCPGIPNSLIEQYRASRRNRLPGPYAVDVHNPGPTPGGSASWGWTRWRTRPTAADRGHPTPGKPAAGSHHRAGGSGSVRVVLSGSADRRGLLEELGLWEARNRKLRDLSGGMQQRLSIALALVGNPRTPCSTNSRPGWIRTPGGRPGS